MFRAFSKNRGTVPNVQNLSKTDNSVLQFCRESLRAIRYSLHAGRHKVLCRTELLLQRNGGRLCLRCPYCGHTTEGIAVDVPRYRVSA